MDFKISIAGFTEEGKISSSSISRNYIFDMDFQQMAEFHRMTEDPVYTKERNNFLTVYMYDEGTDKPVEVELPLGMLCIVGPSNSGKTTIIRELASQLNEDVIRFHEPEYPALLSPKLLIKEINDFIFQDISDSKFRKVMLIDSFKFFAYNSDSHSAAISGGVSTSLFTDLTNLSLLAATFGKTIIVVLNFIAEDDRSRGNILNGLIGSTGGYISTGSRGIKGDKFRFTYEARTNQSKRTEHPYYIKADFSNTDLATSKSNKSTISTDLESDTGVANRIRLHNSNHADYASIFKRFAKED